MARLRAVGEEDDPQQQDAAFGGGGQGAPITGGEHYDAGQTAPGGYVVPEGYAVNIDAARSGETPRERSAPSVQMRQPLDNGEHANDNESMATPVRPRSPQPMAGSVSQAQSGGASTGVMPFTPMGSPDIGSMATPTSNGMFGQMGGLKGGGLGLPLDPISNQASGSIFDLIKRLGWNGSNGGDFSPQ